MKFQYIPFTGNADIYIFVFYVAVDSLMYFNKQYHILYIIVFNVI